MKNPAEAGSFSAAKMVSQIDRHRLPRICGF